MVLFVGVAQGVEHLGERVTEVHGFSHLDLLAINIELYAHIRYDSAFFVTHVFLDLPRDQRYGILDAFDLVELR